MTSVVVRWSQLFLQQNKPQLSDVMASYENVRPSYRRQTNKDAQEKNNGRNTHRSLIAVTFGGQLHKTALLFLWLLFYQNMSLVLSETILAKSNLTVKKINDELIQPSINNVLVEESVPLLSSPYYIDLPSQYQIIGDDDISKNTHFTSTWAVHIPDGDEVADLVAREHGFKNLGKVSTFI